jgi:hypothetical protein
MVGLYRFLEVGSNEPWTAVFRAGDRARYGGAGNRVRPRHQQLTRSTTRRKEEIVNIKAKFVVESSKHYSQGFTEVELKARRETSLPEDKQFAEATPTGSITMCVTKKPVIDAFVPGSIWYLDFTPAPDGTSPMHV